MVELIKMEKEVQEIKFNPLPAIITGILLLLSFFNWPYAYYDLLRVLVTVVVIYYTYIAIYYAYYIYKVSPGLNSWLWSLLIVVILFNPAAPTYLHEKILWGIVDVMIALLFASIIFSLREKEEAP